LGRRDAARNEFLHRPQVARLVMAGPIVPAAAREPLLREPQRRLGEIEHAALPDAGLEAEPRHLVAQPLAFFCRPVPDQIPRTRHRAGAPSTPSAETRRPQRARRRRAPPRAPPAAPRISK